MKLLFHGLVLFLASDVLASSQVLKSKWGYFLANPSSRPAKQWAYEWVDGAWHEVIQNTIQYNDGGDLIGVSSVFRDDSGVMNHSRCDYTYKDQHVLCGIRRQIKTDSGWRDMTSGGILRQEHTNSDGSVSLITNDWEERGPIQTSQIWMSSPFAGKHRREERRVFVQGAWVTQSRIETETNEKGLIIRETHHDLVTDSLQVVRTTYRDSAGLMLSKVREGYSREQWGYDSEGEVVRYEMDLWQENTWSPWAIATYRYQDGKKREEEQWQRTQAWNEGLDGFRYEYFGGLPMRAETTLVSAWTGKGVWQLQTMNIVEKDERNHSKQETYFQVVDGKLKRVSAYHEECDVQERAVEYRREEWNSQGRVVTTGGRSYDSVSRVETVWSKKVSPDGKIEGHRTIVSYGKGPSISPARQAVPELKRRASRNLKRTKIREGGLYLESPNHARYRVDMRGKRVTE